MTVNKLKKDNKFRKEIVVEKKHTTSHIGISVLSTPSMIGLIEKTSNEYIQKYLSAVSTTVGTFVNFTHENPVKINEKIIIEGRVDKIVDNKIKLKIKVVRNKDRSTVSRGTHDRYIVNKKKFSKKVRGD